MLKSQACHAKHYLAMHSQGHMHSITHTHTHTHTHTNTQGYPLLHVAARCNLVWLAPPLCCPLWHTHASSTCLEGLPAVRVVWVLDGEVMTDCFKAHDCSQPPSCSQCRSIIQDYEYSLANIRKSLKLSWSVEAMVHTSAWRWIVQHDKHRERAKVFWF